MTVHYIIYQYKKYIEEFYSIEPIETIQRHYPKHFGYIVRTEDDTYDYH